MGTFGGSHVLQPQNLDFGRPVHKCLCNCDFANNKAFVVIFDVRSQANQVLSLPRLFTELSYSDIHINFHFSSKHRKYENFETQNIKPNSSQELSNALREPVSVALNLYDGGWSSSDQIQLSNINPVPKFANIQFSFPVFLESGGFPLPSRPAKVVEKLTKAPSALK